MVLGQRMFSLSVIGVTNRFTRRLHAGLLRVFGLVRRLGLPGCARAKAPRIAAGIIVVLGAGVSSSRAAFLHPETGPIAQETVARPTSFDHSAFSQLLNLYVKRGIVDYDAFARASEFHAYLGSLGRTDPSALGRDDQLAFWINTYNAYTIQLIIEHHERQSIRNINRSFGFVKAYGPWKEKLAVVGGHAYGLDEIEQDIIRPRFHEPRIHFALVCAAMGCPPLRNEAYAGNRLESQLDNQARVFLLESPSKNRVDVDTRTMYVSPVFVGFRDYIKDFGGSNRAVGQFIAHYYPEGPAKRLLETGDFKTIQTEYDWTLNSKENARSKP